MSNRTKAKKSKGPKTDAYQKVTDKIVELIEKEGKLPWEADWVMSRRSGRALTADGKPYRGCNAFLLGLVAMCEGYSSPYWLTWNRIRKECAAANKVTVVDQETGEILAEPGQCPPGVLIGETKEARRSSPSIYFNQVRVKDREAEARGEDETKMIRLIRYNNVWNADQVRGLPERYYAKPEPTEMPGGFDPLAEAQSILDEFFARDGAPDLAHQGDRAFYRPGTDQVNLPDLERFKSPEGYYSTAFHEVGHATGHRDRLNRESETGFHYFGDQEYSREELVAELTAAFLLADAGITTPKSTRSNAAYLKSWLKKLKSEPKWIVWAAGRAEAAAYWIHHGKKEEYQPNKGTESDDAKVTVVGFDLPKAA